MAAASRDPVIRKDLVFDKWVIFSPARARRPSDFKSSSPANPNPQSSSSYSSSCPFCAGNEHDCAREIFRIPESSRSSSDWKVRVIQNLFPALQRSQDPSSIPDPPSPHVLHGIGCHDVVIETPDHSLRLLDLSSDEIGDVLLAYKRRIQQLDDGSVHYVQVFKNHGASAGASLSHSHSQLVALPLVPPTVSLRLDSMKEHYSRTGKCCLCESMSEELLINDSSHFFSIVPFAASYPFEIWIVPWEHSSYFHEIDSEKVVDLGRLLKVALMKLSQQLNDPPLNFMIHTSPFKVSDNRLLHAHWFLQIVPKLGVVGGFEMGSGCYINPIFPEDAAKILREVNVTL